jgi:hypothetical protein
MNAIERARLTHGKRIKWQGRNFTYCGYAYRAHGLKEEGISILCIWPNGHTEPAPLYEYLSNKEILDAEVVKG